MSLKRESGDSVGILSELTALLEGLGVAVETGVFSDVAPEEYVVVTPLADTFRLHASDRPGFDQQEARVSLYAKGNYLALKQRILAALLAADFTITARQFIGREDDTGYFSYAIDVAKIYSLE
jgi:hypothetical protein